MSDFLYREQAAEQLGVTERTVRNMIKRGLLRPIRRGRRVGVMTEDVAVLAATRKTQTAADPTDGRPTRRELAELHAQLLAMEDRMGVIRRLLNCYHEPLELTDVELTGRYRVAEEQASKGWPREAEQDWVGFFPRIGHDELERLRVLVDDIHPWRPFYKLCATMVLVPFDRGLREELQAGKKNLLQIAQVWMELGGNGPRQLSGMIRRHSSPEGRLVQALRRAACAK
jgi:excisionase family DNA binding protein